ncbi:hypothetical protein [Micromonospora profundi]|uniref:hypothetical protein n=1 Tax=Micromonospora profundi TaxID=1420889 RepID=UPI003661A9DF
MREASTRGPAAEDGFAAAEPNREAKPAIEQRTIIEAPASPATLAAAPRQRFDRQYWLSWALPLTAIAVVSVLIAYPLFISAYPGTSGPVPAAPNGGILLLIDAKPRGVDNTDLSSHGPEPSVAVTAETWTTGFEGVSELLLELSFSQVAAGSQWYVVASGQYFPDARLDRSLFCESGPQVVQELDRIWCRDTGLNGSNGVEYRYRSEIGSASGDKINAPIDSLVGFDAQSAVVITGTVSAETGVPTRIFVPYRSPQAERPSGDELVRLAPVGVTDQEWGALRPVREVAAGYADVFGEFADVQSGRKLRYLPISTMRFSVEEAVDGREIASAMPPTAQPDKLVWEKTDAGIGPISYRLHDPYSQDRTAVKAFWAGLIASAGAAAALLLFEQTLLRFQRHP